MGIGASPGGGSEILSGEIDEVMIFNRTLDSAEINRTRDVSENYTANFSLSGLPDGTVEWNVKATDNESATAFASSNFTFTVGAGGDTTPPVASFGTNPVDGFNTTATSINFSLKCVDETGIDTLKLYGNWTGTWGINQTNSSPVNDVFWNITVDNIPVGTHRWGAFCNDTSDNSDFTDTNRTFTIAVKSVNTSLVTPSGNADFVKNDFEIFTVQACCNSVVNCGMVNASLDPEIQLIDPNTENLEDGWMDSLAPTTEYGVDTVLLLLNDSGASPQERHFMIKFNLSDITADSTINDGELVFNLIFNGLDAGEYLNSTVQLVYSFPTFNVSDSDWVEGGGTSGGQSCQNADLCWSTRPTTSTEINFTILDFFYFTDSSSLTDYTYNVTEAIQFQIDNGKSDVSFYMGFVDAQANFVGDILRFASKEYTDDVSLRPYLNVTFTVAEESTKSGLVSTVPGTLPFWTNTSNPLNATLDAGECKDFTWYVNATGTVGTNHSFFAFVNITSDESINAVTNSINITIISGITDTCIYGGSGNYNVFYADNCTWTDQNFGDGTSNMILGGVGSGYAWCNNTILNFSKIIRNISAVYHYEFRESTCTLGG